MDTDFSTWRVLAVDDELDNLRLLSDVLAFQGAAVAEAASGEQAFKLVDEFQPNVILLDLAMPDVSGWELHSRLRARPELNHVPIIAITALAMPADARRAREAGFDGYITKPFRVKGLLDELVASVAPFFDRSGNHRQTSAFGE